MIQSIKYVAVAGGVSFLVSLGLALLGPANTSPPLIPGVVAGGLVAFLMAQLSGNRRAADADAPLRTRALSFEPEPGTAALYLLRQGFVGKLAGMNLALNGTVVAQLKSPRFTRIDVRPGAYVLKASMGGALSSNASSEYRFEAKAGEVIVLQLALATTRGVTIQHASVDAVRKSLAGIRMVRPETLAA